MTVELPLQEGFKQAHAGEGVAPLGWYSHYAKVL